MNKTNGDEEDEGLKHLVNVCKNAIKIFHGTGKGSRTL